MKKFFLLTVAIFIAAISAIAQDEPQGKLNVFCDYFSRPSSVPFAWAETIRNNVMEGIQQTNRVNLIDVDSRSVLAIEQSRREQENASAGEDMDRLKVMKEEGANLLLQGVITTVSVTPNKDSNGKITSYEASITFTLKVIDPSNATTVFTKTYTLPKSIIGISLSSLYKSASTEAEAVQIAAQEAKKEMKKFVEEAFPTVGKIVELDECKGSEAKSVYINLGSANGMAKGAKFEVRVKRMIGGKTSFKYLGEAEVTDVESDDLSKCKIKKGGKEIYEAFNGEQELVVKSIK